MSSFIVSNECMNNVINGLFWNHEFRGMYRHTLESAGYSKSEDFERLADELFTLNRLAVNSRYNEVGLIQCFKWIDNAQVNKFQVLKSLHCLRYQCSEDRADETKAFDFLNKIIGEWTDFIISSIPEYHKAKWD